MSFQIIALAPVLGSFLIISSVILMVLVIINLFVSAILLSFGKERKSLKVSNSEAQKSISYKTLKSQHGMSEELPLIGKGKNFWAFQTQKLTYQIIPSNISNLK